MQMGAAPFNGFGLPGVYLTDMLLMAAATLAVIKKDSLFSTALSVASR